MQTVLKFLTALGKNNNKEWFDKNKPAYQEAKQVFQAEVAKLIKEIGKSDPAISDLDASKCLFRINRDVRFSKDKAPYKTNFGADMSPGGKGSMNPGYYLHIEPGKSFLASGCWMPEPNYLQAIRQEIDYNPAEFRKIVKAKDFVANYKQLSQEDALKTTPKGYEKDNPNLEFLRLKHFIAVHDMKDKDVTDKNFVSNCTKIYKSAIHLNTFLRRVK
ncbi:MAG: hypothetical protein K0S33_532 [Bacteroidetes bacterium]|jgi:uncharacterized protein (TIGR02453 family)|nr:hypothetical protein [Bacteroidota bacterium]